MLTYLVILSVLEIICSWFLAGLRKPLERSPMGALLTTIMYGPIIVWALSQ